MTKLLGGCLMAVGILVAGLSGLCSAVLLLSEGSFEGAGIVLVVGGVPFVVGLGIFFLGRLILRSDRDGPPPPPPPPTA